MNLSNNEKYNSKTVFVRRHGRSLNTERTEALGELLPLLEINHDLITINADINPIDLFDKKNKEIWMEIGFGNGEHVKAMLERHPDHGYIAVEPFVNGMAAFFKSIKDTDLKNVRVWMDDAVDVVKSLQDASLDGMYILNSDPWPKTKHHKRRIVRPETLNHYSRVLKDNALLIMSTDVDELAEWMAISSQNHPDFEWCAEKSDDWKTMPDDWFQTRYEIKGIKAGRKQSYLYFIRKCR